MAKDRFSRHDKFISWMCPTYGREKYVQSIVDMFLNQDYEGPKEFILINDDPDLQYICNHPEIRIYNLPKRFEKIMQKYNYGIGLCNGDYFIIVADDDEYKSWTTTLMVKAICDYDFMAIKGFYKDSGKNKFGKPIKRRQDTIAGLFICKKDLFDRVGGFYEHTCDFFSKMRDIGEYREYYVHDENIFFSWKRETDHSNWDTSDKEKYIEKDRTPKIIELGGGYD